MLRIHVVVHAVMENAWRTYLQALGLGVLVDIGGGVYAGDYRYGTLGPHLSWRQQRWRVEATESVTVYDIVYCVQP